MERLIRRFPIVLLIWCLASGASQACELRGDQDSPVPSLILPKSKPSSSEQESYFSGLLVQILERTREAFGPCEPVYTGEVLTRMRSAVLVDRGHVDLLWGATTIERESLLRPIRISLLKGLMGYRILLINPEDQPRFSAIETLDQLKQLRAGQGTDWPDTTIFMTNGIEVITSTNYESLYKMLAARRFDFLPRGANQVLSEVRHNESIQLAVEQDLVLVYPSPVYFFVRSDNERLAERIETGLQAMMEDGSFDQYFYSHPLIQEALTELRLHERRPIHLNNPLLPKGTPAEARLDWLRPRIEP